MKSNELGNCLDKPRAFQFEFEFQFHFLVLFSSFNLIIALLFFCRPNLRKPQCLLVERYQDGTAKRYE